MLAKKQHEIMQARLELWRMQKANTTPQTRKQQPLSTSVSTDRNKQSCGKDTNQLIDFKTPRHSQRSRQQRRSSKEQSLRRGQTSKQEEWSIQEQGSIEGPASRQQDVHHIGTTSSSPSLTIREKLEAWLVEKRMQMERERAWIKVPSWNSNKRKLPVSRLQSQSVSFKLRDIETSKYLGNYGQAKVHRSTPDRQLRHVDTPRRKTIHFKENKFAEKKAIKKMVKASLDAGLETVRASSSDHPEGASMECTVNESRAEKHRRARLEEWLAAKGRTPHTVRRSVRRETFDVVKLGAELDNEQWAQMEEEVRMERRQAVDVNSTIDECLRSCLDFMNEMKCESKIGEWLQELLERCPQVGSRALFWVCQAKVAEHEGLGQQHILALYEEAIDNNAKPTDILKSALQDFTIRHSKRQDDTTPRATLKPLLRTPGPVSSSTLKYCTTPQVEKNASSVVRYCLVESTPIIDRFNESMAGSSQLCLVTPVRRSVRIEKSASRVQSNLGNSRCVASLQELPADTECLIMRPNRALEKEFLGTLDE